MLKKLYALLASAAFFIINFVIVAAIGWGLYLVSPYLLAFFIYTMFPVLFWSAADKLPMRTWCMRTWLWIDQGSNVLLGWLWNVMLLNKGARFGYPDETLSSVFGKNLNGSLPMRYCAAVLDFVDPNHSYKSIEHDEGDHYEQ